MLTKEQIQEIRDLLEKAQNPLFFFDNDVDGLCSFLILQRAIGRGKGVPIRSFPDLNESYVRKVDELQADFVFILDKPRVEKAFIDKVSEKNIPIVWIDHHNVQVEKEVLEQTYYFNSYPTAEPTTYLCYKVGRKEDIWLAMIGCIGDVYKPEFAKQFAEQYPELYDDKLDTFDSLFLTQLGRVVKILNLGLKDTVTNVVQLIKYLMKANTIYDVLEENKFTKQLHQRYYKLNDIYEKLLKKAASQIDPKSNLIYFKYAGDNAMSAELSNGLYFKHKDKIIAVVFIKNDRANVSIRGKKARDILLKAIEGIEGASGGGHEDACGATLPLEGVSEFKKRIEELTK